MRLTQLYFDHCFQLFLQRERETGGAKHFIRIGDKFTICFRFSDNQPVEKFLRPFAHLTASELPEPDLTLCVWNSDLAPAAVPPRPTWDDRVRKPEYVASGNIRIFSEINPDTLSLLDTDRRIGLFWINDFNQLPWLHTAHPFSAILAWWGLSRGLQFLHAGCVGTQDSGALIIGGPDAGKSTLCLSAIAENLRYASDDFCLVGTESGAPLVYSLYNTAMLSPLEQIPQLDKYKLDRADHPKAIVSVHESRPEKMIAKVPIRSIVLLSTTESGENLIEPISSKQAISALASSTSLVMGMIGFSAAEFLALHRMFSKIPCFKLYRNTDLSATTDQIATVLNQAARQPGRGVEQCTQA